MYVTGVKRPTCWVWSLGRRWVSRDGPQTSTWVRAWGSPTSSTSADGSDRPDSAPRSLSRTQASRLNLHWGRKWLQTSLLWALNISDLRALTSYLAWQLSAHLCTGFSESFIKNTMGLSLKKKTNGKCALFRKNREPLWCLPINTSLGSFLLQ